MALTNLMRRTFAVMGNAAQVTINGGTESAQNFAERRLRELETRWSRFIATSDISRLNMARGEPTTVHRDTVTLVRYLVAARQRTNSYFDPTMLPALVALGYASSRTNSALTTSLPNYLSFAQPLSDTLVSECDNVVQLPVGLTLDPGGLGKGLAADIVATELVANGADGACVNVGGDLRCSGNVAMANEWQISITSPFDDELVIAELAIADGGVATSSTRAKRWHTPAGEFHHLLSPITHAPLPERDGSPVQCTVVGAEAVWAEVYATAILVAGATAGLALAAQSQLAAMAVLGDGEMVCNSLWEAVQR